MSKPCKDESRLIRAGYKRFSALSPREREEIKTDPVFKRYLDKIRREDWWFIKTRKGWASS